MKTESLPLNVELAHQGLLEVPDLSAVRVVCRTGCLWVTLDHDTRDLILAPGQSFTSSDARRAIVYALEPSSLRLESACAPVAAAARARESARALSLRAGSPVPA